MRTITKIGGIFLAIVAVVVMAGATFVYAQTDSTQEVAPETQEVIPEVQEVVPDTDDESHKFGRHGHGYKGFIDREAMSAVVADALGLTVEEVDAAFAEGTSLSDLAAAQGVSVDDVYAAMQAAMVTAVETAVTDGTLTREQADEILANMELRTLSKEIFSREDAQAVIAGLLGISVEELDAAHDAGTMSDLFEASELTRDDVHEAMETARNAAIDQAEANGVITAEQAEALRDGAGCGRHGGGRHGRGGNHNFDGDGPNGEEAGLRGFGILRGFGNGGPLNSADTNDA